MARNIIEDSDDEGDFGALSPIASRKTSPAPVDPPNVKTPTRTQQSASGTGSTEEIRREIAAAHKEVIDKSAAPNGTTTSSDGTNRWNSPADPRKREPTLSSLDSRNTPGTKRVDRRKSAKTYGQSDRRDYSLPHEENSTFEAMEEGERVLLGSTRRDFAHMNEIGLPTQFSDECSTMKNQVDPPTMPFSLQEDFAGYEPAVMFPTTMSSTVPDATLDQQQLVEAARAEFHHNHHTSTPGLAPNFVEPPSVPWSDFLESTEKAPNSSHNDARKSQQLSQSTTQSQPSKPRASQERARSLNYKRDASLALSETRKAAKRSKTSTYSHLFQVSHDELGEHDEFGDGPSPMTDIGSSRQRRSSRTGNSPTKSQRIVDMSIQESIRAVKDSKAKRTKGIDTSDTLNSDDLAIGLPKEKYVPRPSRSRSARSTVEEPDYSVVPEKAARQRTKRRKTGDVISVSVQRQDYSQPRSTCSEEMGAPVDEQNVAPPVGNGTALSATEQLRSDAPAQKRKRGRPPKKRPNEVSNAIVEEQLAGVTEKAQVDEVDELHHVMPPASNIQGPEQSLPHKEQLLHDPDFKDDGLYARLPSPVVQPTPTSSAHVVSGVQQVEETKPKKRGRSWPRSTKNNVQEGAATDVDESRVATNTPPHDENEKALEMQPDTGLEAGKSHDDERTEWGAEGAIFGAAASALGSSRSSERPINKHEVGAKQNAAAKGGSAEPSPLGKGKVPVRVGLSRRARIAPLLKIVKKTCRGTL